MEAVFEGEVADFVVDGAMEAVGAVVDGVDWVDGLAIDYGVGLIVVWVVCETGTVVVGV